jgi:hypothetical protein
VRTGRREIRDQDCICETNQKNEDEHIDRPAMTNQGDWKQQEAIEDWLVHNEKHERGKSKENT